MKREDRKWSWVYLSGYPSLRHQWVLRTLLKGMSAVVIMEDWAFKGVRVKLMTFRSPTLATWCLISKCVLSQQTPAIASWINKDICLLICEAAKCVPFNPAPSLCRHVVLLSLCFKRCLTVQGGAIKRELHFEEICFWDDTWSLVLKVPCVNLNKQWGKMTPSLVTFFFF